MPKLPNDNFSQSNQHNLPNQVKVVILGGGYGGVAVGKTLADHKKISTTLIDRNSYHLYQSSLYEAANEEIARETVTIPLQNIFMNSAVEVIKSEVVKVDRAQKRVFLKGGDSHGFDYLVVALGAVSNDFGIPGVSEHSFMFRDLKEVLLLRDNLRTTFHMANEREKRVINVTICGGGFSGIELAAELRHHLMKLQKEYRVPKVNITILEASSQILPGMPDPVVKLAQQKLANLKVDLKIGDPVSEVKSDGVRLKSDTWIPSDVTIWTAGTKPNPLVDEMGLPLDPKGRPVVNENLSIIGQPNIFVIGDLAGYTDPKTGRGIPPQAYQAIAMGKTVGQNILRSIKKLPPQQFKPESNNFIVPVGHRDSVAYLYGQVFSGFLPWLLIKFIEFQYLVSLFGMVRSWPIFWAEVMVMAE